MPHVLPAAAPVTAEWLTDVLREAGALPRGAVAMVTSRANAAFNSAALHLDATYTPDAPAAAPTLLFLKRNIATEWARASGQSEVAFYQLVAAQASHLPMIVRCLAAAYDETTRDSFCLLLDVSSTHEAPVTRDDLLAHRAVPAEARLDAIIDALAGFHAFWWQHPALGSGAAEVTPWYRDAAHFQAHVERRRREWAAFLAAEGAWFPSDLRALYERVVEHLPDLWEPYLAPRMATLAHLTLCHGDCYLSQFLCPRGAPSSGPTYLIDWQGGGTDFAAFDLVHLFAFFWTPAQRQAHEARLLRRYHQALVAHGVRDYAWDDLLTDYRLLLTILLLYPIWDQTNGSRHDYWWPKVQGIAATYREWDADQLFTP
jgi:hypothetical protein